MALGVEAARLHARGARRMDVENAERDRQAAAPVDHGDQVGVARIVIVQAVAVIAELSGNQVGDGARAPSLDTAGSRPDCARIMSSISLADAPGRDRATTLG